MQQASRAGDAAKAGARVNEPEVRTTASDAVESAVDDLGGREYTRRDATRVLLGYADMGMVSGERRPGPLARPERWRQSFALKLALAVRGVL